MTATEKLLRLLAGIPMSLTRVVRKRVKNVKLKTKPVTTPKGLFLPPTTELERTMGNIGRMQGESTVTTPPRNAKRVRINI
jgi:hypothetical protein